MFRTPLPAALLTALIALPAAAQSPQPRGAIAAEVGGAAFTVDYGRPDLGDRMLSELLTMLPEDRVWRAGENQVTILETSAPVMIGAETVPAGRYSLYLHVPASGDWSLLVNRNQGIRLGDLSSQAPEAMHDEIWPMVGRYGAIEDEELARIPLQEASASADGNIFEIAVDDGTIRFDWGGTAYQTTLRSP